MKQWMKWGALGLLIVGLAGCKAKNPMVGTWALQVTPQIQQLMTMAGVRSMSQEIDFKEDMTLTLRSSAQTPQGPQNGSVTGTYTLNEKQIEMKFNLPQGQQVPGSAPLLSGTLAEDMKSFTVSQGGMSVQFIKKP